ncbi:cytochrome c biogenesis protein ResB [uncultured Culturomica sp.]|uniref:cytochrome c biogenesis protein ResB n=1 Tax=uncultured Culturomica sp. TaxID=1926654 RepID=UPI00033C1A12|nr:cytochrome c biogenesis protein ResB [uncultured Culturomica sp.]CCZ09124.1 putative membrane protein [Odoribacter sp. CAG:788]
MWKKPWGYREGATIAAGLLLTGILLQGSVGKIDWELLSWPVNIILLLVYIIVLAMVSGLSGRIYLFRWLGSYAAAVTSLAAVVVMTVIMGLIRQTGPQTVSGVAPWLGFSQMLSAWPFALLFTWLITVLGLTAFRHLYPFRWRNIPFLLNHLGLFVAVVAAVLGNADLQRLKMTTVVGKAEWRAYDEAGQQSELPLAIELQHFTIDEYPPKLMLIDNGTGKVLPEGKPEHLLLGSGEQEGQLADWRIRVVRQMAESARVATEDTVKFVAFHSIGATYAVYIEADNRLTGVRREGWVSCGSFLFPYKALRLDEQVSLVMPEREPQRFASDVKLYTQSGRKLEAVIEVNRPLTVEGWKVYQLSYDESKGKWSDISVFELVRDPWLPLVYSGIWMLIAGAVWMFVTASKRKEEQL